MEFKEKEELHAKLLNKLFDENITYPARSINNPFGSGFDDETRHYSINDETKFIIHHKPSFGWQSGKDFISGVWHSVPLQNVLFKSTDEAVDVCVVLHLLEQESRNMKIVSKTKFKLLSKFKRYQNALLQQASLICLNDKFNKFLATRYFVNQSTPENIREDLKEFNTQDYVTDEQYKELIDNIIVEKENDTLYKQSAEYHINKYYNEMKNDPTPVTQAPQDGYSYAIGGDDGSGYSEEYYEDEPIDETIYCKHCKHCKHKDDREK